MANNRKKPVNNKKTQTKPVANKKVTTKQNNKPVSKPVSKKVVTSKKSNVKKPVIKSTPSVKEIKVEQVSISEQIPAPICCNCTKSCKSNKKVYIFAGIVVLAIVALIILL